MYYFMSKKLVVLMKVAKKYAWGLFNGSEVLMSTCIYKQNRGR